MAYYDILFRRALGVTEETQSRLVGVPTEMRNRDYRGTEMIACRLLSVSAAGGT